MYQGTSNVAYPTVVLRTRGLSYLEGARLRVSVEIQARQMRSSNQTREKADRLEDLRGRSSGAGKCKNTSDSCVQDDDERRQKEAVRKEDRRRAKGLIAAGETSSGLIIRRSTACHASRGNSAKTRT